MGINFFLLLFSITANSFTLNVDSELVNSNSITLLQCSPAASGFEIEERILPNKRDKKLIFKSELSKTNLYFFEIRNNQNLNIYRTEPFLLSPTVQFCTISQEYPYTVIVINEAMGQVYASEYYQATLKFKHKTEWLQNFTDSIAVLQSSVQKDSLLSVVTQIDKVYEDEILSLKFNLHESKDLKNNYFKLWMIYDDIYKNGYNEYHQYFYKWLDNELKDSFYGKNLVSLLHDSDRVKVGDEFPSYEYFNLKTKELSNLVLKSNYTFIDFWFSGCGKCITQFPQYIDILVVHL
jgi:thiol-disulfide isomerase/thioredoxin